MNGNELKLIFDPRTIGDLGIKMYTRLPHALAEAISNAYDADAGNVDILIHQDSKGVEYIEIIDNGFGMTRHDLANCFLIVGRKRRNDEGDNQTPKGRMVTGRKGLGKLAMFGIAEVVEIETVKDNKMNAFLMDWDSIKSSSSGECVLKTISYDEKTEKSDGTKITLKKIKRKTLIGIRDLAVSLSRRFNFGEGFCVNIKDTNKDEEYILSNELKLDGLEVEGEFSVASEDLSDECSKFKGKIRGTIKTTKKPLPHKDMQGVSLFARNKLVNEPTSFGSVSSNFFRYITGEIYIDFIEDEEEDLIATNRRSLDWDNEKLKSLEECLTSIINGTEKKWRKMRKKNVQKRVSKLAGFDIEGYQKTLPEDKREAIQSMVDYATDHPEDQERIINTVLKITPEHAAFHWRYLHPKLKQEKSILDDYRQKNFISAVTKAWEIYEKELQDTHKDSSQMGSRLVTKYLGEGRGYGNLENDDLGDLVKTNLKNSNRAFAEACCAAANITRHHETKGKRDSIDFSKRIFTDQDCLDILSAVSHLLFRLDRYHK